MGLAATQDLAQTANSYGWIAAGEGNQVFDASAHLNFGGGLKTDAAGTDVPSFFCPVDNAIAYLNDVQGQLEFIPLCSPLFQDITLKLLES